MLPLSPAEKKIFSKHPRLKSTRVFKFTTRDVAKRMCELGSVRIGSLQEYVTIESEKLKDGSEGKKGSIIQGEVKLAEAHAGSLLRQKFIFRGPASGSPVISNLSMVEMYDFPIMCFTYSNEDRAKRSLCDSSNNYDACIEVRDVFGLAGKIAQRLSADFGADIRFRCLPVIYRSKIKTPFEDSFNNDIAAFEKEPRFSENDECRILFREADNAAACELEVESGVINKYIFQDARFSSHFRMLW